MKSENNLSLEKLDVSNLPELQGWKDKQETLVKENPFVEITDNKTYEVAKASRTALLKGRTSLESQEKAIASKLASFRKDVGTKTQELIDITLPHENKQQEEVKRFEQIKENERLERERIEKERVDGINAKITDFETDSYKVIQSTTFEAIDENKSKLESFSTTEFDFEEFDILFEQAKDRVKLQWDSKVSELQEKENQRLENERIKEENERYAKQIARTQKLASSGFSFDGNNYFVADFKRLDLGTIMMLSDNDFDEVVNAGVMELSRLASIEEEKQKAIQDQQEAERKEREEKEKAEKDQVFEIRKKRLEEIGVLFHNGVFMHENSVNPIHENVIYDSNVIDFENILTNSKKEIKEALEFKEIAEKEIAKQEALQIKQAKENAKRVKRLSDEKSLLTDYVQTLEFYNSVPNLEQKETSEFLDVILKEVADFKTRIINQINEL